MHIQIKCRFTGAVRFEGEFGSLKLAVEAAVKAKANLRGADLGGADLGGADLRGANLRGADLGGADLGGAYLRGANLRGADLGGADLHGADLGGADLRGADLRGADLRGADLRGAKWRDGITLKRAPLFVGGLAYPVWILDDHMQIGCELHALAEWEAFDNERIARMDGTAARRFWAAHKAGLLALAAGDKRGVAQADTSEGAAT